MSRVQKFSRKKGASQDAVDESAAALEAEWGLEASEGDLEPLPPRGELHPSNKQQMSRWFYRTLIVLFIVLLIGMLWWGRQFEYGLNN